MESHETQRRAAFSLNGLSSLRSYVSCPFSRYHINRTSSKGKLLSTEAKILFERESSLRTPLLQKGWDDRSFKEVRQLGMSSCSPSEYRTVIDIVTNISELLWEDKKSALPAGYCWNNEAYRITTWRGSDEKTDWFILQCTEFTIYSVMSTFPRLVLLGVCLHINLYLAIVPR